MSAQPPKFVRVDPGTKPTGTISTWLRKYEDGLRRGAVDVPCGACTACCRAYDVEIEPDEDTTGLDVIERNGERFLRRREDGACVHLGPGGCTVREQRPKACRIYDCRVMFFAGVSPGADGPVPTAVAAWKSESKTREDRVLQLALRLSVWQALTRRGDGNTEHLCLEGLVGLNDFLEQADEIQKMVEACPQEVRVRLYRGATLVDLCAVCGATPYGTVRAPVKDKIVSIPICKSCWNAGFEDKSIQDTVLERAGLYALVRYAETTARH